jgi:hypothetical protein
LSLDFSRSGRAVFRNVLPKLGHGEDCMRSLYGAVSLSPLLTTGVWKTILTGNTDFDDFRQ